jgi:hypothetical protein
LKTDDTNVFSIFKNSSTRTTDGGINTTTIRNEGGKLRLQNYEGDNEGITIWGSSVGIGTSTPQQILQVGNGGRLRISNSITDYTLIGTKETDDVSNTRIVLSGYDRTDLNGSIDYVATNTGAHIFYTSNSLSERMRITSDGRVGIGTSSPGYTFYVTGTRRSYPFSLASITRPYDYAANQTYTDPNVIAGFDGAIYSWGHWTIASDYRIKTNFSDINNSIQTIRELHPVTYYNIDYNKNGGRKRYGFIAQEVRKKLPDAITERCDAVPTSYFHGKIVPNNDGTTISIETPESASNPANSTILLNTALLICDCDKEVCFEGVQVDGYARFKIFGGETNADPYDIYIWNSNGKNCKDGKYTYQIGMKTEESETICRNPCVFIYGQYVNDFHTLEYNVIWAITTAALQEVDRQQQADKARIAELETEVVSLKQELQEQQMLIKSILERL